MTLSLRLHGFVRAALAGLLIACASVGAAPADTWTPHLSPRAYAVVADQGVTALLRAYYAGNGLWRDCPDSRCWVHNSDWGSDALTNTLYLRYKTTGDARMPALLAELANSERFYASPCRAGRKCSLWSDVPMWDSVAALREHDVLAHDSVALQKAVAAFWAVEGSPVYALGACPAIRYQRPFGRGDRLKTLETDSNGIKAALLLYGVTHEPRYLAIARTRYRSVRRYFLDALVPLYSVYVFDDGMQCRQAPHRYFASVNGNMIWNGLELAKFTGNARYRMNAIATAHAVVRYLSDPNGVFSDLQAENDLEEPLVEGMLALASIRDGEFARNWLLDNAAAAFSARRSDGTYGRFFDGPPPVASVTAWQTNGGFAVQIAAASLAPDVSAAPSAWNSATYVPHEIRRLPAHIRFYGSGIALIGTIGEICCQPGHARILIDGVETTNQIGTWQNKSSSGRRFPNSVLFAWRWRTPGTHEITLQPGIYDAKEGGPFLHARGYAVLGDVSRVAVVR
ncbi:MAG: hypothetical protein IAI50_04185 [Candidatus Eremiobacteraeota bacterium]|nr:hypothetical protein [Candidatus Eremiobacteraeota bacterium]